MPSTSVKNCEYLFQKLFRIIFSYILPFLYTIVKDSPYFDFEFDEELFEDHLEILRKILLGCLEIVNESK